MADPGGKKKKKKGIKSIPGMTAVIGRCEWVDEKSSSEPQLDVKHVSFEPSRTIPTES